jgi:prefoldin subunit 5
MSKLYTQSAVNDMQAKINELEKRIEQLRAALEYYANQAHWTIDMIEGGQSEYHFLAKRALAKDEKL